MNLIRSKYILLYLNFDDSFTQKIENKNKKLIII